MSKSETVTWHVASNQLIRKGDGWFGKPKYEVSTRWQTKLTSGIEVQDMWKHKTFTDYQKAFDYYVKVERGEL